MSDRWDEIKQGWTTVAAAGMGACAGLTGLGFYSFGLFVKPLSEAFGWSRGQVGLGLTFITLGTVLCAPAVGLLIDRFGVRKVAAPSLLGMGLAYGLMSLINGHIGVFYLACFALAVLGCATSPVTWTRAVSLRFQKNRGAALGLTMLGSAFAGLIGGPLLQGVIGAHGWRAAYLAMAGFTLLVAFPVVASLLRGHSAEAPPSAAAATGSSLKQAMATAPFWIIGVAILLLIAAQSGVIVHLVPLLTDRGLSGVEAAAMAGVMGLAIVFSRVIVGVLLDRFDPPVVAGLVLLAPVVAGVTLAMGGDHRPLLTAAVLLLGISAGAEIDFLSFFAARYFGLRAYGRIYGTLFAMFSIGNGLGAPLVGAAFDRWGNYGPAMWAAAGLFAVGAALFGSLVLFKPAPQAAADDPVPV